MPAVSLCMIVKNEEMHITRCLDSVAELVDEIIVVDTGSTDRTVELVSGYTSKIYSYPWKDDFADARNYSLSRASMDYCMWMDADDILEETEKDKFLQLKQTLSLDVDIVMMKYHTSFDDAGKPSFSYFTGFYFAATVCELCGRKTAASRPVRTGEQADQTVATWEGVFHEIFRYRRSGRHRRNHDEE